MRRTILIAGLACGVLLSTTVRADEATWTALTQDERVLVDAVAADLWREAGGRVPYALIGDAERAALREAALDRLGTRKKAVRRRWI